MANKDLSEGRVKIRNSFMKKRASLLLEFALLLLLIGGSYAIVNFMKTSDANVIKTGQVSMSYAESNTIVSVINGLPMTDAEGKKSSTYFDFTITSNASTNGNDNYGVAIPYNLILQEKELATGKTKLASNQIKVYLTKVENGVETQVIAPTLISHLPILDQNYRLYATENVHKNNNGAITTNYRLRAWIDYKVEAKELTKNHQYKFSVNVNGGDSVHEVKQNYMKMNPFSEISDGTRFIQNIVMQNKLVPIESAVMNFDISKAGDGSVMAYVTADDLVTMNTVMNKLQNDEFPTLEEIDKVNATMHIQADGKIIAPENSSSLFSGFAALKSFVGIENLDTSHVTNMSDMFYLLGGIYGVYFIGDNEKAKDYLIDLDLSGFDTSNVINMSGMFSGAYDMDSPFSSNIRNLDLSSFDTSNVTDMSSMFQDTLYLKNLNLSNFDTSRVTNMSDMFNDIGVTSLNLSSFDTSKVVNMKNMFYSATNLTSLNLSNFDTSKVTDMTGMFSRTKILNLDFRNAIFDNVTKFTEEIWNTAPMFYDVPSNISIITKNATTKSWLQARLGEANITGATITTVE